MKVKTLDSKRLNTACLGLLGLSPVARIKRWYFTFPQIMDTHLNCKCYLHNFYNLCNVKLHPYELIFMSLHTRQLSSQRSLAVLAASKPDIFDEMSGQYAAENKVFLARIPSLVIGNTTWSI